MINFHPDQQMLLLHAEGKLPLSLSIAVSAHLEYCGKCQQELTSAQAKATNTFLSDDSLAVESQHGNEQSDAAQTNADLDSMLDAMMSGLDDLKIDDIPSVEEPLTVEVKGEQYSLPRVFKNQLLSEWQGIGKVTRSRLDTGEGKARASLLHIDANGEIPQHTHKGTEITLLLAGEFSDEYNQYKPGDLMVMTPDHKHSPKTMEGCLCYTVVDAPLYFTKGISKLLNPIGELIY
ncbi:anti-sigma factor [Shewanella sp. WXL01]|uniref:ChrR family anti-sigma-E factor n=1 Tax=Shewanella sp. WXL01 TaxID=2709721 RepID=UPI0014385584|nr:ChrR family anti-sigma-E factor [Shewanella sp. WXL01]NKF51611.1 anti-sigma factor [Shewanella sp. WXL01]